MKLYAFQHDGHGAPSFYVCAENFRIAKKSVDEYIRNNLGCAPAGYTDDYLIKELDPMVVIENDND